MKIGVVLMLAERRELKRAFSYRETREMAIQAEETGIDSIWLYDHLIYRYENEPQVGIWECWTMLSALAEATEKVELGTVVLCNSFRNPAVLAKMAHTLDEVSEGRLILGLGAGWNKPEYDAFGLPFDHRVDRFEEALQIIHPLLKEGKVDFTGKYYQARDCEIVPRSPRPSGPPLLVGSFGPRMLKLTAQYADLWNTAYLSGPETLVKPRAAVWEACKEVGRDPATLGVTALLALHYPDLSPESPNFENGVISGTDEEIAAVMHDYEAMGVAHIIFHLVPYRVDTLNRLGRAVQLYHTYG